MFGGAVQLQRSPPEGEEEISGGAHAELINISLGDIVGIARSLTCVIMNKDVEAAAVHRVGFGATVHYTELAHDFTRVVRTFGSSAATVFLQIGSKAEPDALDVLDQCAQRQQDPPCIALVLLPDGESMTRQCFRGLRCEFFHSGADDVVCSTGHLEPLGVAYFHEVVKTAAMKRVQRDGKLAELEAKGARQELEFQEELRQRAAEDWKASLWSLPGNLLPNVPMQGCVYQMYEASQTPGGRTKESTEARIPIPLGPLEMGGLGGRCEMYLAEVPRAGGSIVVVCNRFAKRDINRFSRLKMINSEFHALQHVSRHPNLIRVEAMVHTRNALTIVTSYDSRLDLHTFVLHTIQRTGETSLPLDLTHSFAKQWCLAVAHLHSFNMCHQVLKPTNVIVAHDGLTIKLCGFDCAMKLCSQDQRIRTRIGSLPFVAPEAFNHGINGYSAIQADCWSLGCCMVELAHGPYALERLLGWLRGHPAAEDVQVTGLLRIPELWSEVPEALHKGMKSIVAEVLRVTPEERVSSQRLWQLLVEAF